MNLYQNRFAEKLREALTAVSPTLGIVFLLSFTIAPIPPQYTSFVFVWGSDADRWDDVFYTGS